MDLADQDGLEVPKPDLLLGPGLLCTARLWEHQIDNLADVANIQVVETRKDSSLASMARRVLENSPDRFSYAGLSMGGYLAFEILRLAPHRVHRLALLDTAAYPDSPERMDARRALIDMARHGNFDEVKRQTLLRCLAPARLNDPAIVGVVDSMFDDVGPRVFEQQTSAIMNRKDSRPSLRDIAVETLVICGRQDQGTPLTASEEIAAGIPTARLEVIEDCGHLSTIEQPVQVTRLLRQWLLSG